MNKLNVLGGYVALDGKVYPAANALCENTLSKKGEIDSQLVELYKKLRGTSNVVLLNRLTQKIDSLLDKRNRLSK